MKSNIEKNIQNAILILSCDKYSDLWDPFFHELKEKWPDCPFKIYLGSNTKKSSDTSIVSILSGKSIDWSTDLLSILEKLNEDIIYIWLEDHFPTARINTKVFIDGFDFMRKNTAKHMHVSDGVKPDLFVPQIPYGSYEGGAPYRVTVAGFWDKQYLQKLLIPGENPWKFEIMGSYRSSYTQGFYAPIKPLYNFIRIVDKGKITRLAYNYCKKNDIPIDIKSRNVYSPIDEGINQIKDLIFKFINNIPWRKRLWFMNLCRRLLITY